MLGQVPATYQQLHAEWPQYQTNLESIMKAVLPCVSKSGFVTSPSTQYTPKLVHSFYEVSVIVFIAVGPYSYNRLTASGS